MGVSLREILTDYKKPASPADLAKTCAVDGNNALYQFVTTIRQPDGTPLMDNQGRITSHLSGLFFRVTNFLESGMRPIFIFDGKPPEMKQVTIEARRELRDEAAASYKEAMAAGDIQAASKYARSASRLDAETFSSSQKLLTLMGIPWFVAPSEGEAQAAVMAQKGDVAFSISQDYDSLLFGTPRLVRNMTVSRKRKVHGRTISVNPEIITLSELLGGLKITRENLIEMGILIGTDFNDGIKGIGPKKALKIVRDGAFEKTVKENCPNLDCEEIMNFFLNPPYSGDYKLNWKDPDTEGILSYLCEDYEFSRTRIEAILEKLNKGKGQKTLDQWFG